MRVTAGRFERSYHLSPCGARLPHTNEKISY